MMKIACSLCQSPYPQDKLPYRCACGGSYDLLSIPAFSNDKLLLKSTGLLKYRNILGLMPHYEFITLGEGNTPLVSCHIGSREIHFKMESLNPTGSYKDRGTAVLVSFLKSRGVQLAVEDSSGNAGASFAAYCARAGMQARIYVPASASGPKRRHIEISGAELIPVNGTRAETARRALREVDLGIPYASHAWLPFGLSGIATIAYEIVDQLGGGVPGTILAPVGHGGLLYGTMLGFENMLKSGAITTVPYYVGIQSALCDPISRAYSLHDTDTRLFEPGDTCAEGVRVSQPVRGSAILHRMLGGMGSMLTIEEAALINAWKDAALHGLYIEPTSALVWAALSAHNADFKSPVVALITGSGYKSSIL